MNILKGKKTWQMNKNKKRWKKKGKKKKEKKELRRKVVAKNKELKRITKAKKEKEDKKELWSKFKELNMNFAKMQEHKKTIIKRKRFACNLNIYFYHTYVCKYILIKNYFFVKKKGWFYFLPCNRIHKKKETKRLNNLPSPFTGIDLIS